MSKTPDETERNIRPSLRRRAAKVSKILHATYGSPRHGNKDDPLDELVFIVLSQMTTGPSFNRVYDRLKSAYPSWDALVGLSVPEVERLIKDAGLAAQKAPRLLAILQRLRRDFGVATLDSLRAMSDVDAERYLTTLPGVGLKTAKCVLMYSLAREVLPVDTHVWRVTRRLGLVQSEVTYTKVHDALEAVVKPTDRYSIHVNGLAHGRTTCTALRPRCVTCPLRRLCPYPTHGIPPK